MANENGTTIAKAYVQIMPSAEGIQGRLTDVLSGPLDQAGKSAGSRLGGALKGALATAVKVGTAVAVTKEVVDLTKQAVSAYADYEQLTGGVETLFKDSADQVMKYAGEAYKTAGLSANQYMETVTSFSASLLQSLGGDTKAAADMADLAITDMSDNANKMGSDMASIQNAYQGFAKQNYTMLDNLKLGYGGTQAEMQRLLDDAEKLSGVHYDISSYADIVQAIHVVQTEMGITGTTAKEAAETVSGSLGMLKGAWKNLLVGMADPAADLDKLISDLVDSAGVYVGNLIPVVKRAVSGLFEVAGQLVRKLGEYIADHGGELGAAAGQLIVKLGKYLISHLPQMAEIALKIVGGLAMFLVSAGAELIKAGAGLVAKLGEGIKNALKEALQWGRDLIANFIQGIKDKLSDLWQAMKDVAGGVKKFLGFSQPELGPLSDFDTYAPDMMDLYAKGIRENSYKVTDAIRAGLDIAPSLAVGIAARNTPPGGWQEVRRSEDTTVNAVLVCDDVAFGRLVFRLNKKEAQRMGVDLVGGGAA